MLHRRNVSYNLRKLDSLFLVAIKKPKTYKLANFYAKVAVLEACSWLENCIDKIFEDIYTTKLIVPGNKSDYKYILDRNYGFHYKENVRNKLSQNLFGLIHIEQIERKLNAEQVFNDMRGALGSLKTVRDDLAHEHQSGSAINVQTVAQTKLYFEQAYEGLKLFEKEIKKIKFK